MPAFTATKVAALTGLDERAIHKDLEHGIVVAGSPPRFSEVALVYFRATATFALRLGAQDRRRLHAAIADGLARGLAVLDLGHGWTLDLAAVTGDVRERAARFEGWRCCLVSREDVLGGEPVFPGSRLAVRHVGEMLLHGAEPAEVLNDYPELQPEDLEFARPYVAAYPGLGRPRGPSATNRRCPHP